MTKKLLFFAVVCFIATSVHAQMGDVPKITSLSVSAKTIQVGGTLSATWNKSGNFPAKDSYFVFLKNKSDQLLGSHVPVQGISFTSLAFWQPTLTYPTFTFPVPLMASGTYYLELDFVDPTGALITTATSNAFNVTPLILTIGVLPASSSLSPADRLWVSKVQVILNQLSPLLIELSQKGIR